MATTQRFMADRAKVKAHAVDHTPSVTAPDEATTTARELYDAMLKLYPDRANPGSLWSGANAAKKQA
jgi:hypothetical protein